MPDDYAEYWDLANRYNFNHGSFGATPQYILERRNALQAEFDRDRQSFFNTYIFNNPGEQEAKMASFVGADAKDLVFVDNATDSFNSVLKSLDLGAGDEVLVTSQMYANFPPLLEELSRRRGFSIVCAELPYPPQDEDEIVDAIVSRAGPKTKLAVIDHITSPAAIIQPVEKIVAALNELGIDTFVDGAHAPGQIEVNVKKIGAAYYTANHHKWLCAPVNSGFLYVRRDKQAAIIPAVGSGKSGVQFSFKERFQWIGTRDVCARLCVADTIDYMASLHPAGWKGIVQRNHELALLVREKFTRRLGLIRLCPNSMLGSFFTVPLGALSFGEEMKNIPPHLHVAHYLQDKHGFFAYAFPLDGQYLLRVSCHLYNREQDYDVLADAIAGLVESCSVNDMGEKACQ